MYTYSSGSPAVKYSSKSSHRNFIFYVLYSTLSPTLPSPKKRVSPPNGKLLSAKQRWNILPEMGSIEDDRYYIISSECAQPIMCVNCFLMVLLQEVALHTFTDDGCFHGRLVRSWLWDTGIIDSMRRRRPRLYNGLIKKVIILQTFNKGAWD